MPIQIVRLSPDVLSERLPEVVAVYREIYGMPPQTGERFADMLRAHAEREGFRLTAATAGANIIGFGYGFTGAPGQQWRDWMASALGPTATERWLDGHFELAEVGVIPGHRCRGIGSQLLDAVVSDLPNRNAVLTVRAENQPARAFYERRGWQTLFETFFTPAGRGPYHVMGRDLPLDQHVRAG